MRFLLVGLMSFLGASVLVGCSTCQTCGSNMHVHEDSAVSGCDECVSSWPKFKTKKSKHKHDNCPLCTSSAPMASAHPVNGCSGCGAPAPMSMGGGCSSCGDPFPSMTSGGCSSCGIPASSGPAPLGCSSCGHGPQAAPTTGCSSCGQSGHSGFPMAAPSAPHAPAHNHNHGDCPHCRNNGAAPMFEGEVIPGALPPAGIAPMAPSNGGPTPAPAPPAEDTKPEPAPLPMSATLIPILPPANGPRHVNWVPTPVK